MAHTLVKPERIAAVAATALEQQLVVPAIFQREGIENFRGARDDAINVKVRGVLPFRTYGWRNPRTDSIKYDEYTERSYKVEFGGDIYSAIHITDEQATMDLEGWTDLVSDQTEAVGRGLEFEAVDHLNAAPYAVTLGGATRTHRETLVEARKILNAFNQARSGRTLIVGTDWESELLTDPELSLESNVGINEAENLLQEASIGKRYGFNIVVSQEVEPHEAFALAPGAFIFASAAPPAPHSVGRAATASARGVAVRWLQDYDTDRLRDRSVVNTYKGFRHVQDPLVGRDATSGQAFVSTGEHFVRAIKLDLEAGTDVLPEAGSELASITGVSAEAAPVG